MAKPRRLDEKQALAKFVNILEPRAVEGIFYHGFFDEVQRHALARVLKTFVQVVDAGNEITTKQLIPLVSEKYQINKSAVSDACMQLFTLQVLHEGEGRQTTFGSKFNSFIKNGLRHAGIIGLVSNIKGLQREPAEPELAVAPEKSTSLS